MIVVCSVSWKQEEKKNALGYLGPITGGICEKDDHFSNTLFLFVLFCLLHGGAVIWSSVSCRMWLMKVSNLVQANAEKILASTSYMFPLSQC